MVGASKSRHPEEGRRSVAKDEGLEVAAGSRPACPRCLKPQALCVCAALAEHRGGVKVLVLRHPQEKDRVLGTARMIELQVPGSRIVTGLSWRNLKAALGRDANPHEWGVLYQGPKTDRPQRGATPVVAVDRKGKPDEHQEAALEALKGVIVIDGTWSQAKTLWWRNPWLLKCRRLVLAPSRPSAYGRLRREPRRDSLSTLEAAALALSALENDPALYDRLTAPLRLLVEKAEASGADG
ncbi:MAG: DTW domain-containing protein [Alphaproteobacteria bacterium]|nr:DTW domain-containing protein [Alphaproteobacteria bacterium]